VDGAVRRPAAGHVEGTTRAPTDGAQWGAPEKPNLKRKFITTTWVAALVWALVMFLVFIGWMPLPDLAPPV
jgi:predicted secreted protein